MGYDLWCHKESDTTERLSLTLYCSLTGFSVHGDFQARTLEWVAISFSRYRYRHRYRYTHTHTHTHIYILIYNL